MAIQEGKTYTIHAVKRKAGASLQVCEDTVNFCPYCGSKKIEEVGKRGSDSHLITCQRCCGLFLIPCED